MDSDREIDSDRRLINLVPTEVNLKHEDLQKRL